MPIYKVRGKKKDGLQAYRVRVNYTDMLGRAKQLTRVVYGSDEAKATERNLSNQVSEKTPAARMSIDALSIEYLKSKRNEVRTTSLEKSERTLRLHVLPFLGEIKLDKLTPQKLQAWKEYISNKGYANATKQGIYAEFRSLLNYAVKLEYINRNPLCVVGNFRDAYFDIPKEKMKIYTADEFEKYMEAALEICRKKNEYSYYVFFAIAFYTGMRKGEINALKWTDIDGNVIQIRRSVVQKIKGRPITETPPKNKSSVRDVIIPQQLKQILDWYQNIQKTDSHYTDEFRVCGGQNCLPDSTITVRNVQFAKAAGLHHIRIHDFRHSHASLLANEGINIQEIANRLGHSDTKMTWNTYAHLYPREEERAVRVLDTISVQSK